MTLQAHPEVEHDSRRREGLGIGRKRERANTLREKKRADLSVRGIV